MSVCDPSCAKSSAAEAEIKALLEHAGCGRLAWTSSHRDLQVSYIIAYLPRHHAGDRLACL